MPKALIMQQPDVLELVQEKEREDAECVDLDGVHAWRHGSQQCSDVLSHASEHHLGASCGSSRALETPTTV